MLRRVPLTTGRSPAPRAANSPLSPEAVRAIDLFFAVDMGGCAPTTWIFGREAEIARLYALPDAALRAMGLNRDDLPRHVFRDILQR